MKQWLWLPLALLAFSLPFELDQPLLTVGPLAITNVEVLLGICLLAAALSHWRHGTGRPQPVVGGALLSLAIFFMLAAAVAAPVDKGNALKAALRGASGIGLMLATVTLADSRRARQGVVFGLAAGALLAAILGLIEVGHGAGLAILAPFRPAPFRVGPYLRLSGPYDYANQAAMALEATLPWLWLGAWQASSAIKGSVRRQRLARFGAGLGALLLLQAALLTLSRAAAVTMIAANVVTALAVRRHRRSAAIWGSLAGLALLLLLLNQLLNPVFRLRLQEDEADWYRLSLAAPGTLQLAANETQPVTIEVTNKGTLIWDSDDNPPIRLGARWYEPGSDTVAVEARWHLGETVRPGESVRLTVPVRAPAGSARYVLIWDMVQEGVTWFSGKTGQAVQSEVFLVSAADVVSSGAAGAILASSVDIRAEGGNAAYGAPQPPRLTLWRTALAMISERPLLGWGLDSFRRLYGPRLDFSVWDETVHTNSWYLELIVSLGLLGALPFLLWLGWLAAGMIRGLSRPAPSAGRMAAAAALLTFFGHGLLDYFLLFNATALLFWLLAGLWLAWPETDTMSESTPGSKVGDANWV